MATDDSGSPFVTIPATTTTELSDQDISFLKQANIANLSEVSESTLAVQKAPDTGTQVFGGWMYTDHSSVGNALNALASQLGVSLGTTLDAQHQAELDKLNSLYGSKFSQAYDNAAVSDHAAAVSLFQQEISNGQNPSVVAFAKQMLPILQAHYQGAQTLVSGTAPQTTTGSAPDSSLIGTATGTPSTQDIEFAQQAAQGGLAEVAEGHLAAAHTGNPGVSEFGQWMAGDHSAMNAKLMTIATQEGVNLPTAPTAAQQEDISTLQSLSDPAFFKTYVTDQVVDHAQTLMLFAKEAASGTDPALVSFAQQSIPVLGEHLAAAIDLKLDQMGLPAGASGVMEKLITSGSGGSGLATVLSSLGTSLGDALSSLPQNVQTDARTFLAHL